MILAGDFELSSSSFLCYSVLSKYSLYLSFGALTGFWCLIFAKAIIASDLRIAEPSSMLLIVFVSARLKADYWRLDL